MRRPINWITVSISLFFLVLGLSLRDAPRAAPVEATPAPSPRTLLAFPMVRREPLKFERIALDSPAAENEAVARLASSPERAPEASPALISFETVWYVDEPTALRAPEMHAGF